MKIVDRKTFLTLPSGTLYAKVGTAVAEFGELCIKHSDDNPSDWIYAPLANVFDHSDTEDLAGKYEYMLLLGHELPVFCGQTQRDGLFEDFQMFLIYDQSDIRLIMSALEKCLTIKVPVDEEVIESSGHITDASEPLESDTHDGIPLNFGDEK